MIQNPSFTPFQIEKKEWKGLLRGEEKKREKKSPDPLKFVGRTKLFKEAGDDAVKRGQA